ncbi:MAG: hypothetical protein LBU86_02665 [Oscillospiraceae bacterium]|jgi:hypothetical protein|nr:hypothetical protein [Oscillospiraceae bacterium]
MAQAQIVLTPTESKKLIAHAVLKLPEVRLSLEEGILALHPSSSTCFIFEELTGCRPEGLWVCGVIAPSGLTGSREAEEMIRARGGGKDSRDPRKVSRQTWVFKRGVLQQAAPLGEILDGMGENDVYVKGVNAVDAQGNAGVLFANPAGGGGTIGRVLSARRNKNFNIILPAGYEKLIPGSVKEACHAAGRTAELAMGLPCGLYPVDGKIINETDAISLLYGVKSCVIAAGGLGGAEGAVVLALQGEQEHITAAFAGIGGVKGAKLPELQVSRATRWDEVV